MLLNLGQPLVLMFAFVAGMQAVPTRAQEAKYWIDHMIADCQGFQKAGGHLALAWSPAQYAWCQWGADTQEEASAIAAATCTANLPASIRSKAACRVILQDERIVEPKILMMLRRDQKRPVKLKIYDGATDQLQEVDATIVLGKYTDPNSPPFSILLGGGEPLCNGNFSVVGMRTILFDTTCFGKFRFSGKSKVDGFVEADGLFKWTFSFKLTHGKSWISGRADH